jgi:hypothetical protein
MVKLALFLKAAKGKEFGGCTAARLIEEQLYQ